MPAILLLPGTCCHWEVNFGEVIPLLDSDFHVVCVFYDGFDETEQTGFPDIKTPDIQRRDMQHEGLLIVHPGQWAEEIRECCGR